MRERTKGTLLVLLSTVFFALSTVGVKYATRTGEASAAHVAMARFLVGLAITLPMVIKDPSLLRPRGPLWVGVRAVGNVIAVFLFFFGIQYTSVSKANLLNMTYPVFVFFLSPFVTGEKTRPVTVMLLVVTMFGVWNVVRPDDLSSLTNFALGDLLAFSSAILAGLSIAALRKARTTDSTKTIVFYIMALGAVANLGIVAGLPLPSAKFLLIALAGGLSGAIGQFLLTIGFAHVSAQTGSLLSTARILIAVTLGVVLFGDIITLRTIVGATLIVGSLIAASSIGQEWARGGRKPSIDTCGRDSPGPDSPGPAARGTMPDDA